MNTLFYLVPAASLVALLFAWVFFRQMFKESEDPHGESCDA